MFDKLMLIILLTKRFIGQNLDIHGNDMLLDCIITFLDKHHDNTKDFAHDTNVLLCFLNMNVCFFGR